jgi:ABC-type transport system substrate-binding protein
MAVASLLSVAALILTACGGQTIVQTQIVERVVTQEVEVVQEVEREPYTTPHPILSDIRVRKAIAYCTDRAALVASVYGFVDDPSNLLMDTNIPNDHWAHADGVEQYPYDPAQGMALLDEAGWTLAEGATVRSNAAGEALSLHFTTTNAAFRQTWAAVMEESLLGCGIEIVRLHAPASWWFGDTTGLARRDFELGAFAWVGEADPDVTSLYACELIPLPSNNWNGQNYMGWCNETASAAIIAAGNTLDRAERVEQYAIFQQEFAKDMISLPLFNRVDVNASNVNLVGLDTIPGEPIPTFNIHTWELPGEDTLVLGLSQEPASLYQLVEDAFVVEIAAALIQGRWQNSLNYDFQANMYYAGERPSVENGGAVIETVDVAEGTVVVDANGDVGPLAAGMSVKDADGNTVEFSGGTVPMQQMTVVHEFADGITWSDGEPLKAADIELAIRINCDPESGATSLFGCDRTASESATDTSYTWVSVPGFTPATYFSLADDFPAWYPSHLVTSDGRTLADVPAAEWLTLPEVAESPIGTGPYMITEWVKGQSMTFAANPNFYLGAPATPNVVIKFVADTNQAVAQLLTGEVDVLFSETLGAGEEVLAVREAADRGEVAIYILPSATWEHVDFNLFIR